MAQELELAHRATLSGLPDYQHGLPQNPGLSGPGGYSDQQQEGKQGLTTPVTLQLLCPSILLQPYFPGHQNPLHNLCWSCLHATAPTLAPGWGTWWGEATDACPRLKPELPLLLQLPHAAVWIRSARSSTVQIRSRAQESLTPMQVRVCLHKELFGNSSSGIILSLRNSMCEHTYTEIRASCSSLASPTLFMNETELEKRQLP